MPMCATKPNKVSNTALNIFFILKSLAQVRHNAALFKLVYPSQ